ncbi:MAG: methyltransferase domain-containing protein [Pseudomonadota bacterium]
MNVDVVRNYYGQVLSTSDDLKTSACCTPGDTPDVLKRTLANVHDEVLAKYYGCGLLLPEQLSGLRILDLGCGAGRDVFVLSQLVGPDGHVVGVDMTPEQIGVARSHVDWHMDRFGYSTPNVTFLDGYIEKLDELDLEPASFDLIVSNCVINLSPDKPAVLRGARSLLKPGGELYFADVYADRRLPLNVQQDPVLLGECLGGALYWNDFLSVAKDAGFGDPRLVTSRKLDVSDNALAAKLGEAVFYSATYRLFHIDGLEPACEDYGQAVRYKGTIEGQPHAFALDNHHHIETGRVFTVCGNTWRMLKDTRFTEHFDFIGDFSTHYGIFPGCGTVNPLQNETVTAAREPSDAKASGCC